MVLERDSNPEFANQEKSIRHGHVDDQMMQFFSHRVFYSEYDDKDVTANTDYTENNYSNVFSILLQVTFRLVVLAVFGRGVVQCNIGSVHHVASKDSDVEF